MCTQPIVKGHLLHLAHKMVNLVTTPLRKCLAPETCDILMRLKIEGPNLHEFDFTKALLEWMLEWRKLKDRAIFRKPETQ